MLVSMASRSSDGGREGDNSESIYQQLMTIPKEVTSVLEKAGTDITARPMNISILHDYAMDHVFSFLPMKDLKNCRLVNHSWNRVSNRAIQKRDFAIVLPEEERYVGGHYLVLKRMMDIPKLVQLIRTSFQFPWTKFKVDAKYVKSAAGKRRIANLLRVISPFVTEIDIDEPRNCNLENLEYPKLRKLTLWYRDLNVVSTESNQKSLLRLVERASKLNDVDIFGSIEAPLYMELLGIPNCRKITRLSLSWRIEGKHLIRLSEMGLQLKFLSLVFEVKKLAAESVKAMLQSQSTCLEELALSCGTNDIGDPRQLLGIECPRMDELKMLRVPSAKLYSRISYKDMFPALKRLTFWPYEFSPLDNFFNDDIEPVETVEYVSFGYWSRNHERILQAARQFPKLRRVSLRVSRNLLNVLGRCMPQLEEIELQIGQEYDMDSILMGFPSDEVEILKSLPVNQLEDVLERSNQFVNFLKKLRRLRMFTLQFGEQPLSLSDFGCRFGLLKMEQLRILELKGNFSQISQEVMEGMREKFIVCLETD